MTIPTSMQERFKLLADECTDLPDDYAFYLNNLTGGNIITVGDIRVVAGLSKLGEPTEGMMQRVAELVDMCRESRLGVTQANMNYNFDNSRDQCIKIVSQALRTSGAGGWPAKAVEDAWLEGYLDGRRGSSRHQNDREWTTSEGAWQTSDTRTMLAAGAPVSLQDHVKAQPPKMRPETTPEMLAAARRFVLEKPSTSYIQRKLMIGFNHACEIMEHFEAAGLVSARRADGKRVILAEEGSK